ncbi:SEP-domain-containing protein [Xylariaceae sp. FL1019]|nr:SEP-domain-containing protein [Xylariaceae sp. FL1019]
MADNEDHDVLTAEFVTMTGATAEDAQRYLSACGWHMTPAIQAYLADEDERGDNSAPSGPGDAAPADYTGPRTLDGRPAPQAIPTTANISRKVQPKKKGLATLSSLGAGSSHDHDDDDSDDDDDDAHRDTYAGGEKSGLAVQDPSQRSTDPKRIINDLLSKAKSNAQRPEGSSSAGPSSPASFRGAGQTLGGEGTESRVIPDPRGPSSARDQVRPNAAVQERTLHLWRDGFSVDDGELHSFSDPNNSDALRMIQQGRAPLHLMNVRYDEPIDVKLQQHDENWRQLPKIYKPFGGEGRRLGSPVPGDVSATASLPTLSTSNTAAAAPSTSTAPAAAADESQPTIMIRIQMLDGSRLPARFNTTQTVNDIYDFISRASPGIGAGGWVLATTFPNKDHTDKSLVLGDMAEFKKGGTAVVKKT